MPNEVVHGGGRRAAARRASPADELTHAQRNLLVTIWAADGCDSYCDIYRGGRIIGHADKRTLISLVARGLLQGKDRRITATTEGEAIASAVMAEARATRQAPGGRLPAGQSPGATREDR